MQTQTSHMLTCDPRGHAEENMPRILPLLDPQRACDSCQCSAVPLDSEFVSFEDDGEMHLRAGTTRTANALRSFVQLRHSDLQQLLPDD